MRARADRHARIRPGGGALRARARARFFAPNTRARAREELFTKLDSSGRVQKARLELQKRRFARMTDRTFSDRDVIRIFERHLTAQERRDVELFFETGVTPNIRFQEALNVLLSDGPYVCDNVKQVITFFRKIVDSIDDWYTEEAEETLENATETLNDIVSAIDTAIHEIREVERNFPPIERATSSLKRDLLGARRFLIFVRPLVTIPRQISEAQERIGNIADRVQSLDDALWKLNHQRR